MCTYIGNVGTVESLVTEPCQPQYKAGPKRTVIIAKLLQWS